MSKDAYLMPGIGMSTLKEDTQLIVGNNKITLKGTNSSIYNYIDDDEKNDEQLFYYCCISQDSFDLLTYLFRKYNNLIGGDGWGSDAGYKATQESYILFKSYSEEECEEAYTALFIEFAIQEMIDFKHFYEFTDDEVSQLEGMRKDNKEKYEYWRRKIDEEIEKMPHVETVFDNNIQTDSVLPF